MSLSRNRSHGFTFGLMMAILMVSLLVAACSTAVPEAPAVAEIPTLTPVPPTPTPVKLTYTVQRGDVTDALFLTGRVAATRSQDLFFRQEGHLTRVHVKSGDRVERGQLVAEIDPGTLPNKISEAQSRLATLQESIALNAQRSQLDVRSAELSLEEARAQLVQLQRPPSEFEISSARLAIEQARTALDDTRRSASLAKTQAQRTMEQAANAVRDAQANYANIYHHPTGNNEQEQMEALERAQRAIENAQLNLENARASYEAARESEITSIQRAEQQLAAAEMALQKLMTPPDPAEIEAAQRAVNQAQLRLDQARLRLSNPDQQLSVQQTQREIAQLQEQLEERRLYAPFAGQVTEVIVQPGDQVAAFAPIVNIMDPTSFEVVVDEVLDEHLARITVGQEVTLTFPRYPQRSLPGKVRRLPTSPLLSNPSARGEPYLRIAFDHGDLELAMSEPVEVLITFSHKADTLWLPPEAVRSVERRSFVVRQEGDQQRRVDIKVGIVTPDRIEILEGLAEGDVVIEP